MPAPPAATALRSRAAATERFGLRQVRNVAHQPPRVRGLSGRRRWCDDEEREKKGRGDRGPGVPAHGCDDVRQLAATTISMATSSAMMRVFVEITTLDAPPTSARFTC